jgi:protein translocase SecG subunit
MISFLIGLLSIGLWALCLMLILLILVQLPKKEAGAGLAFGAGAAEAVFGAGAGTPLSKFTRLCATSFLAVALLLYVFNAMEAGKGDRLLEQEASAQVIGTCLRLGAKPLQPLQQKSPNQPFQQILRPQLHRLLSR